MNLTMVHIRPSIKPLDPLELVPILADDEHGLGEQPPDGLQEQYRLDVTAIPIRIVYYDTGLFLEIFINCLSSISMILFV